MPRTPEEYAETTLGTGPRGIDVWFQMYPDAIPPTIHAYVDMGWTITAVVKYLKHEWQFPFGREALRAWLIRIREGARV